METIHTQTQEKGRNDNPSIEIDNPYKQNKYRIELINKLINTLEEDKESPYNMVSNEFWDTLREIRSVLNRITLKKDIRGYN